MPDGLRLDARGQLPPGLVRPVAVVMGYVLTQHQIQVTFTQDQDPVEEFAAQSADYPLEDPVG